MASMAAPAAARLPSRIIGDAYPMNPPTVRKHESALNPSAHDVAADDSRSMVAPFAFVTRLAVVRHEGQPLRQRNGSCTVTLWCSVLAFGLRATTASGMELRLLSSQVRSMQEFGPARNDRTGLHYRFRPALPATAIILTPLPIRPLIMAPPPGSRPWWRAIATAPVRTVVVAPRWAFIPTLVTWRIVVLDALHRGIRSLRDNRRPG